MLTSTLHMYCILGRILFNISLICSYLKTLLDPFNEMVNRFLEEIKPLADGEEAIPMKHHLGELTLNIISKVSQL